MKVLLVNPRNSETFWSFERVLRALGKKGLLPPLGLVTVAAFLPPEWEVKLADLATRDMTEEDWNDSDLVLVTGMIVQRSGILQIIREAKQRGKTVVIGGSWVFHFPEEALQEGADIVVRGEAETAMPALLQAIAEGRSGVVIDPEGWPDLRETPPPLYDLLELDLYADMALQFSRGCPFKCEFCDITLMFGPGVRTKSFEQIFAELQALYDLGWRSAVFFVDDNFIGNPVRAKALLRELVRWQRERGYPYDFYTQTSVNLASDQQLLDLMVEAGFFSVFVGIETTDLESLEHTRKYQNTAMDLNTVCERINRAGLEIIAGCIIGFDNEAQGADRRLIDFALRNQIPEMFATLLQAGPGTDLWNRLEGEQRLLLTTLTDNHSSQTAMMNFVPTRSINEIAGEFVTFYDVLYEPSAFLERAYRHLERMARPPVPKRFAAPRLSELKAVAITILRYGVINSCRWTFWRLLFKAVLKFPQRARLFLVYAVKANHYDAYRRTIKEALMQQLQTGSPTPSRPASADTAGNSQDVSPDTEAPHRAESGFH